MVSLMDKKALGFMDVLLFCLAMLILIALITYIWNPFNIIGNPSQYVYGGGIP